MQINDLEIFIVLCDAQSFSKAANLLYISQPALSQRIQKLESEIGFSLIDRNHKNGFRLTPAGEHFLDFANNTLHSYNVTLSECNQLAYQTKPSFIIGIEQFDVSYLNQEMIFKNMDLYNQYDLQVEYAMHRDLLDHLFKHDFNCVFMAKPVTLPKEYHFLPITTDKIACIWQDNKPYTKPTISTAELQDKIIYLPRENYADMKEVETILHHLYPSKIFRYYQSVNFPPNIPENAVYITNYQKRSIFNISHCVPLDINAELHLGFIYASTISSTMLDFLELLKPTETKQNDT